MKTKNKITMMILFLLIIISSASASETEISDINKFLSENTVSELYDYDMSYVSAYYLAKTGNESGFNFGVARFHTPESTRAYNFCYVVLDDGSFLFIDAKTDELYRYNTARYRLSGNIDTPYVTYSYYYPYTSFGGSGPAPAWMSKAK